MADYGTKWIEWEGKSPWPDGCNYRRIGRDGEIHATCAIPDKNGWVKNPGFNVWPDDAVVEVEWRDGFVPAGAWGRSSSYDFRIGKDEPNITRSRLADQETTTPEEDEAWAEAEARMNVIGQNGNTGEHYDMVNHPPHYTAHPSGVECIQITEHMGFCLGNAMKYIWRADLKNGVEDLQKAKWYIEREIAKRTERVEEVDD